MRPRKDLERRTEDGCNCVKSTRGKRDGGGEEDKKRGKERKKGEGGGKKKVEKRNRRKWTKGEKENWKIMEASRKEGRKEEGDKSRSKGKDKRGIRGLLTYRNRTKREDRRNER